MTSPTQPLEEFAVVDQWAAEAYLTALDAMAWEFLDLLEKGIKIHNWMWDVTKAQWPDKLPSSPKSETGYNYKKAKQTVHALNYGVKEDKMMVESGLPREVCAWQYMMYHNKFPGIQMRQERIARSVQRDRKVTSVLGRNRYFFQRFDNSLLNKAYAWPSQSTIGEITNIACTRIFHWGLTRTPWMFPALNTHDGLAIRALVGNRDAVKERIREAFRIPLTLHNKTIIIPVSIQWGPNFNDLGEEEILRYGNVT